jgi:hypothetical protein
MKMREMAELSLSGEMRGRNLLSGAIVSISDFYVLSFLVDE